MVCKSCGAHYKMRDMKCPYCGTENIIGVLWAQERTEAEEEYNAKCRAAGRKPSAYVYNRVISRVLFVELLLVILFVVGFSVISLAYAGFKTYQGKKNAQKNLELLEQAYQAKDTVTIDRILDGYGYFYYDDAFDKYQHAILAGMYYTDLEEDRMKFWAFSDDEKGDNLRTLSYSIYDSFKILGLCDKSYYEECADLIDYECEEAYVYLSDMLGMTDEEIEYYRSKLDDMYDESKVIAEMLGERNGWK